MKHIDITVALDGSIKLDGIGFVGKECDAKMKAFEEQLGQVKKRTNKPDFYKQTATTKETVKQKA